MDLAEALRYTAGDRALLAEVLAALAQEAPGRVEALRRAVASTDAAGLETAAHALKGPLRVVGAMAAAALAQRLEALGRAGRFDGAAEELSALEREVARVLEFAAEVRGDPSRLDHPSGGAPTPARERREQVTAPAGGGPPGPGP